MRLIACLSVVALVASPALAQSQRDCDTFEANARNMIFPVEENTESFANGDVRLIALDAAEPACCSYHLMVVYPDPELFYGLCTLISHEGAMGFANISLSASVATYDPASGLTVRVPVEVQTGSGYDARILSVTVNQQTGEVIAR